MSNILDNLRKILTSRYGRDVRQAIHDGILNCYEDGKAGAIDMTARDAIQAEAVTRENEDNALDERVQALEAGGAGLSDLDYEAWVENPEQYEAEDKGYIVPMQKMTPEGEKIFLFDTNDIALDKASKSVLSSSTAGGAFREIISNLNGIGERFTTIDTLETSCASGVVTKVASITLPKGNYVIRARLRFAQNSNGYRALSMSENPDFTAYANGHIQNAVNGYYTTMVEMADYSVTEEEQKLYMFAYQNSGSNLAVSLHSIHAIKVSV